MNTIFPFTAIRYSLRNRLRIGSLAVADLDTAEHLWGDTDSSFSFRNVLVGMPSQRSEIWQAWMSAGEIELVDKNAFYILHQSTALNGKRIDRWAVFATVEIDNPNIRIHEDVFPEGVERARQSSEACEGDIAPIFMGCDDDVGRELRMSLQRYAHNAEPMLSYSGEHGSHMVWSVEGMRELIHLQEIFQDRDLYLLDGHHRLAAAKENMRLGLGDGKILVCVCSMEVSDTMIQPIHRAVYSQRWTLQETFLTDLSRAGVHMTEITDLRPQDIPNALSTLPKTALFAYALFAQNPKPYRLELPLLKTVPPELAVLPVAALDYGVLGAYNKLTTIPATDFKMVLEQLAMDQAQVGFFLPPVSAAQVRAVAKAGLKMPQKSTRFMPKPSLGLICRPWL